MQLPRALLIVPRCVSMKVALQPSIEHAGCSFAVLAASVTVGIANTPEDDSSGLPIVRM